MATVKTVTGATPSRDPYTRGCPSRDLLDRIGDKWAVLVLGELARHGTSRFTHLRSRLAGVSEKISPRPCAPSNATVWCCERSTRRCRCAWSTS
ncbi:winged helix-turn-helix transcriptional regulator [Streptomyces sp. M19]